jgi:hypothetical protein
VIKVWTGAKVLKEITAEDRAKTFPAESRWASLLLYKYQGQRKAQNRKEHILKMYHGSAGSNIFSLVIVHSV